MKKLLLLAFLSAMAVSCSSDDSSTPTDDGQNVVCHTPSGIQFSAINQTRARFTFAHQSGGSNTSFVVEYGETGFQLGNGLTNSFGTGEHTLTGLNPGTTYDLYVKAICDGFETPYSEPRTFTTDGCNTPITTDAINITTSSAIARWSSNGGGLFEVEYGLRGFTVGSGATVRTGGNQIELTGLDHSTEYDVYVRTVCVNDVFSNYSNVLRFKTLPICITPTDLRWTNLTSGSIRFAWQRNGESNWQVEYGLVGFTLGTGTKFNTSTNPHTITQLQGNTTYEIYMRANCGGQGYSEWSESLVVSTL